MAQPTYNYRNSIENTTSSKKSKVSFVQNMLAADYGASRSRVEYVEIPIEDLTPRSINNYSQGNIEKLAKSIKNTKNRLIHPIVVARGQDLDPEGEVYRAYQEKGVVPETLRYVIVSGERRYHAWQMLWKEWHDANPTSINPFDTITANVLTRDEAKKEKVFHEDANLEARRISTYEALLHVKDIVDEIRTEAQKRDAMKEMGEDPDKGAFSYERYCLFCLKGLRIENVTTSTIKHILNILNNGEPELKDAVLNEKIPVTAARQIASMERGRQLELLNIYLDKGAKEFQKRLAAEKEKSETPKGTRVTHKDAAKVIQQAVAQAEKYSFKLKEMCSELGETDRRRVKEAMDLIDECVRKLNESHELLK